MSIKFRNAIRGLNKGLQSYNTAKAQRDTMQQKKQQFELNQKIKNLELKKYEDELDPETLKLKKDKLKLEKNTADLIFRTKELELKNIEKESKRSINDSLQVANKLKQQGYSVEGTYDDIKYKTPDEESQRRTQGEQRRQLALKLDTIDSFGATVSPEDINVFEQQTGVDISDMQMAYGLEKRPDGSIFVPSKKARDTIIARQTISTKEMEYLSDLTDASETMSEVLTQLKDLGISREALQQISGAIPKGYFKGIGPLSLKARFNVIADFSDPKFGAIKDKLERVFQKYRKIITGAQASDKELKGIRPLVANLTSAPERFFENAEELIRENDRAFNTRLDLMEGAGRNVSKLRQIQIERQRKRGTTPMQTATNMITLVDPNSNKTYNVPIEQEETIMQQYPNLRRA